MDTAPRTPDQQHQQRLCQGLIQSQGWREVVLPMLLTQMAAYERTAGNSTIEATMRLEAIARKDELQGLVVQVYKRADEPNPFDAARLALWSTLLPAPPKPEPESTKTPQGIETYEQLFRRAQRGPTSGSVA